MIKSRYVAYLSFIVYIFWAATPLYAQGYFAGKTISILSPGAGGGYDIYSRFLAPYLSKHLPGNPRIIVRNMPGSGTLEIANFIYSVAPKDGLTIGAIDGSNSVGQLLHSQGVKFDPRNFDWVGNMNSEVALVLASGQSKIKTFKQLFHEQMIVGAAGPTSGTTVFANVLNRLIDTKFKLVSGYGGTGELLLAMERGEIEGVASVNLSSLVTARPDWLSSGKAVALLQMGRARDPSLPQTPLVYDFAQNETQRQIMHLIFFAPELGRPFVAPPGLPPQVAQMLRDGFWAALNDPELKAEAKLRHIEMSNPARGEQINKQIDALYQFSPEIIAKAASLTGVASANSPKN